MAARGVQGRSWLAVAAVLGLVGSLLAVGGGVEPAEGLEGEADNEAVYSACVGAALDSAGLVDVEGTFAEDAVNCLAHFGVTRGRTETTYDPGAPVSRWQMALFLSRAAGPAGVVLPANPADEFTDIAGWPEATRTAVNQMAALGIMPGSSGTVFGPGLLVSRAEMASMLDAFLLAAENGSGLGLGALGGDADELADVVFDDSFDDIGNVTRGQYSAIRRMFELGVARGTSDDSFSPGAQVTRAQMAVFITRMLAHTVARPAGLTLQAAEPSVEENDPVGLAVSVRDSDLLPMPDAVVDVFSATSPDDAFGVDGRCSADDVSVVGGSMACEIAFGDLVTGPSGDVEYSESFAASSTLWAWTGDVGDRFDSDDTVSSSVELAVTKPAVKLRVTDDLADNATAAKFGDRVAFTLQLVDEDGNAVSDKDVSVAVASALVTNESGSTGNLPQNSGSSTYKTDASGKVELSFVRTDPRAGSDKRGDVAHLDLDISLPPPNTAGLELEDKTALEMAGVEAGALVRNAPPIADAAVVWRDSVATASVLTLTQDVEYHEADKAGAAHTVRAILTDQYGDPISRRAVEFASDDAAGVGAAPATGDDPIALMYSHAALFIRTAAPVEIDDVYPDRGLRGSALKARTKTTNRRGVATLTYTRDSDATGIETITARVKAELSVPLALIREQDTRHEDKWDPRSGDILAERIYHYWASEPAKDGSARGRLMVNDAENNRLVLVGDSTVSMVEYDANDQLTATSGAVTLDDFEKDVKDNAEHITVTAYQTDSRKVSRITAADEWARLFPFGADEETADNLLQRFGSSFAADNGVIVVGAPRYQSEVGSANRRVGRVYVYDSITDDTPAILSPPTGDAVANAFFGDLVDIDGDTIVVGSFRGKAFVYEKPSGGWADDDTPDKVLTPPNAVANDRFGRQAAIDGDTIVVGSRPGISVFERDSGTGLWNDGVTLLHNVWGATGPNQRFDDVAPSVIAGGGRALAIEGDTIVAANPISWTRAAESPTDSLGHVAVFTKPDGGWVEDVDGDAGAIRLTTPDPVRQGRFGRGVAIRGDVILISEPGAANELGLDDSVHAGDNGRAYIFMKPAGGWATTDEADAVFSIAGSPGYGSFGTFAAISPDGGAIAIGEHTSQPGDWLGSVYVFTKPAGGWATTDQPSEQYAGPIRNGRLGWGTTFDRTTGALMSSLRQERVGTASTIYPGKCSVIEVPVGSGATATTVDIQEHCLRYLPIYLIDR